MIQKKWAIILGGSGGFGLASAKQLVLHNYNLILIYRERKKNLINLSPEIELLKEQSEVIEFNINANDVENQNFIINKLNNYPEIKRNIHFFLHAIADGNLKPILHKNIEQSLTSDDLTHTIQSMGLSMYEWTKILFINDFFSTESSILGLTSEGSGKFFQNYAAVASAKAVMESNMRYMAVEMAKYGIRANLINAGITDTQALKAFPNYNKFIINAKNRNPYKRLTTPDDVAKVVAFMASENSYWINGSIINVDGGEQLISFYDENF